MNKPAMEHSTYTYEDYRNFPDDFRCEIIKGEVYDMTPAPSVKHQEVVQEIGFLLRGFLRSKKHRCRSFIAPTDVVLAENQVIQPDVFLVCDETKIKDSAIFGAPDVIFEVISPSTEVKDRREKMMLYEYFGVQEYFLVHPERQFVEKYTISAGAYRRVGLYKGDEAFLIETIGLELTVNGLFAD